MALTDNAYGMQDIQQTLLDMMLEIDRVCRKCGIEYTLLGGTMLGAVREGGFIPWDDDLDIGFTRPEWQRFLQIFPGESADYTITQTDTWVSRVVPRQPIRGEYPFVDLFHYEPISASPKKQKLRVLALETLQGMLKDKVDVSAYPKKYRPLLIGTRLLGLPFSKQRKLKWYRAVYENWARGDGSLVHVPDGDFRVLGRVWPAEMTHHYQDVSFEGATLRMLTCWDEMLTRQYGDYMQRPPEGQRMAREHSAQRKKG